GRPRPRNQRRNRARGPTRTLRADIDPASRADHRSHRDSLVATSARPGTHHPRPLRRMGPPPLEGAAMKGTTIKWMSCLSGPLAPAAGERGRAPRVGWLRRSAPCHDHRRSWPQLLELLAHHDTGAKEVVRRGKLSSAPATQHRYNWLTILLSAFFPM